VSPPRPDAKRHADESAIVWYRIRPAPACYFQFDRPVLERHALEHGDAAVARSVGLEQANRFASFESGRFSNHSAQFKLIDGNSGSSLRAL
jgi:hypothetical protein